MTELPFWKNKHLATTCDAELESTYKYQNLPAVSAGIQMEKALGLYKHLSFLFIYSLSDRFTKNL